MRYLVLLDFDGTLAPIAKTPSQARLSPRHRKFLSAFARLPNQKTAIISGRQLSTLKKKVGIPGINFIGNHGLEMEGPRGLTIHPAAEKFESMVKHLLDRLTPLKSIPGILLENKKFTFSIHYRRVPPKLQAAATRQAINLLRPETRAKKITISYGKKVIEVRPPVKWDKGKAVAWLVKELKAQRFFPIYFGDDTTDEPAFQYVKRHGLGIRVGKGKKTAARISIKNPGEVFRFLHCLQNMIKFGANRKLNES